MGELSKLPNLGKVVEEQLNSAGINSKEGLELMGSKAAWLKIREKDPSACLHKLYALEGAIQGIKKSCLGEDTKNDLRNFFRDHQ